jgi:gluconate 5-dehydrogenase
VADLASKRARVTGASRGLGREIAGALERAGAHVIVHGRNAAELHTLSRATIADGGSCEHVASDLRAPQAAAKLAALGAVQILVSNAGGRDRRSIAELDRAAVRGLLDVNLVAPFELARAFAGSISAGGGIINVSSIAG